MKPLSPQKISSEERNLVFAVLRCCADGDNKTLEETVSALYVVGRCDCGCGSILFDAEKVGVSTVIAEGVADDPAGDTVQIILRARDGQLSELEIVSFAEVGAGLPYAQSVRSYEEESNRRSNS